MKLFSAGYGFSNKYRIKSMPNSEKVDGEALGFAAETG